MVERHILLVDFRKPIEPGDRCCRPSQSLHQVVSRIDPSTKHLNSIVPCIKFTVEKDSDNRILPFLDVQLCREERKEEWKSVEALSLAL